VSSAEATARSVSRLFDRPGYRIYARMKVASDPLYEAAWQQLRGTSLPIFDLGCGLGILGLYLRERGLDAPVVGVDSDRGKVEAGRRAAARFAGITLEVGDARDALRTFSGNVVLLDVIHYLTDEDQLALLHDTARAVAPGGVAIIRDCLRDDSWRFRATQIEESFAKAIGWLKVPRLNFPTIERFDSAFPGFERTEKPMWGRTPFNNHLLVYRRPIGLQ
jgi:SAM-dependent methyltransferase